MTGLLLTDPNARADLETYLGRAAAIHEGSVRVIAEAGVLAVYAPVIIPASLLDDSATILGLRTFAMEPVPEALDLVVPIQSLRARVAAAPAGERFELGMPTPVYSVTWAGVVPPRSGWAHTGHVDAALLAEAAVVGIAEVAEAIPKDAGEAVVRSVRALVWNQPIPAAETLPRGVAFAAHGLGFLQPATVEPGPEPEQAQVYEVGPWTRVSLARGHVLVKRRAWSLAG